MIGWIKRKASKYFELLLGLLPPRKKESELIKLAQAIRKGEALRWQYSATPQVLTFNSQKESLDYDMKKVLNWHLMRADQGELNKSVEEFRIFFKNKPSDLSKSEFNLLVESKAEELRIKVEEFYNKWEDTIKPEYIQVIMNYDPEAGPD